MDTQTIFTVPLIDRISHIEILHEVIHTIDCLIDMIAFLAKSQCGFKTVKLSITGSATITPSDSYRLAAISIANRPEINVDIVFQGGCTTSVLDILAALCADMKG